MLLFYAYFSCVGCCQNNKLSEKQDGTANIQKQEKESFQVKNTYSSLIFEDDFEQENTIPDTTKWSLCPKNNAAWGKHLSESYEQVFVENGNLILLAEKVDGKYQAGGIRTLGKFDFQYGRVEVKAKFTKTAKGGWPAIWMMPSPKYVGWPDCGEIDIMEQLNNDTIVYHTIHSHYKNTLNLYIPLPSIISFYKKNEYNVYAVEWTPESITFFVNGMQRLTYPNWHLKDETSKRQWPFNAPFYLILNYALGGENTWPGLIRDEELPAKMEIDWVKVFQ